MSQPGLEIRPLAVDEAEDWLRCADGAGEAVESLSAFKAQLAQDDSPDWTRLLAWCGACCVGRLRLLLPHPGLCLILSLAIPAAADLIPVGTRLLAEAEERAKGLRLEALCWDKASDKALVDLLLRRGYQLWQEKLYVERELEQGAGAVDLPFELETLDRCGEEAFVQVMAGLESTPTGRDALEWTREEFHELVAGAGKAFDPGNWWLANHQGHACGLVLPQIFADEPTLGTLFYIGLLPDWRGRGWGKILHAHGLALLAARGATRYVGSTELANVPMRRIFSVNGCREKGIRRGYRQANR